MGLAGIAYTGLRLAAPVVLPAVVSGIGRLASDHMRWNSLNNTYSQTINDAGIAARDAMGYVTKNAAMQNAAELSGRTVGKIIAPTVTLSEPSMQAANKAGGFVKDGIEMVGNATVQHVMNRGTAAAPSAYATALKVAAGIGMLGVGVGAAAFSPEIAFVGLANVGIGAAVAYFSNRDAPEVKQEDDEKTYARVYGDLKSKGCLKETPAEELDKEIKDFQMVD